MLFSSSFVGWQCTGTNTVLKCHGGTHWSGDEHTFDLLLGRGWVLGTLLSGGPSIAAAIATTSVAIGPAAFVGTGFTSRGASVAVVAIGMFCQRLWWWWCPIGVGVSGSFCTRCCWEYWGCWECWECGGRCDCCDPIIGTTVYIQYNSHVRRIK